MPNWRRPDMAARLTALVTACVLAMAFPIHSALAQREEPTGAALLANTGAVIVTFERENLPANFTGAVVRAGGTIVFNLPNVGVSVVAGLSDASVRRVAA